MPTQLNRAIVREFEREGQAYRVEVSPFGIVLYAKRGKKPLYEMAWETLLNRAATKEKRNGRERVKRPDMWAQLINIYNELDALRAEVAEALGKDGKRRPQVLG